MPKSTVLITTSGTGSRLGSLTEYTNKSLITIGDKPALARIIEQYPTDTRFVITLGHFGKHVKQFLELAFPQFDFEFVEIDNFSGPKSSLALSMMAARDLLQEPFIYNASDSILLESIESEEQGNWLGGYVGEDGANYASFDSLSGFVSHVHEKGMVEFDYIHTGVVGVEDYELFWSCLDEVLVQENFKETLNDLSAVRLMLDRGSRFRVRRLNSWIDIGTSLSLHQAENQFGNPYNILRKRDESISFCGSKVIKFFYDSERCAKRVRRANELKDLVPTITASRENFYSYQFVEGTKLSKIANPKIITKLLDWSITELWNTENSDSQSNFRKACEIFYKDKTYSRLDDFYRSRRILDTFETINEEDIPPLSDFLDEGINFCIADCKQTRIHGDFILDNIISKDQTFLLLDWREDFANLIKTGDIYYDLSKLNHSLVLNHEMINMGNFDISIDNRDVICNVLVRDSSMLMREIFNEWITSQGFNQKKVSLLTSIIWLNMSPLHHHPFDLFLYYYGKLSLWRALNEF